MWALFDEDIRKLGPFDAIYLDLHGAMVAENTEDGEGELLRRIRGIVGDELPIVASLDYHANLTPEMAQLATALVGYRTYPHIDMAVTGKRAVELLDKLLKEKRPVYRAYRQLDFLIPLVWQCTFIEPAKGIFDLVGELEAGEKSHNQGIVSVTHTPGFPPADIAQCGPALVVYGHDKEAVEAAADKLAATVKAQEKAFAGELLDPDAAALRAIELSKNAKKPIVLADVQDNPGAGGTSDTVGLLAALMRHKAKGAVIGMIVDEGAAKAAVETGEGNIMRRGIGAVVGYAGEKPLEADWRVVKLGDGIFTGTGPFYGGAKFQIGPMALVTDEASGVSAVLACKRVQAADQEMFRPCRRRAVARCRSSRLKSTVHFRADFQPIAETILVVQSPGAHITDPVEMPYKHLRKGIRLRPMGPVHGTVMIISSGRAASRPAHEAARDARRGTEDYERNAGRSAQTIGTVVSARQRHDGERDGRPMKSPSRPNRNGLVAPATEPPV